MSAPDKARRDLEAARAIYNHRRAVLKFWASKKPRANYRSQCGRALANVTKARNNLADQMLAIHFRLGGAA